MRRSDYDVLKIGDIVCHKHSGNAMVIIEVIRGVPVLARYTAMSNSLEWDKVSSNGEVISSDD